jgi:hypothetical protein
MHLEVHFTHTFKIRAAGVEGVHIGQDDIGMSLAWRIDSYVYIYPKLSQISRPQENYWEKMQS